MNRHDLSFGGTFCVLPWIQEYTNIKGARQFCCYSDREIASVDQADILRQKIWNKEKIPHCDVCYQLENKKTISPRQKETVRWFKQTDVRSYFSQTDCPEFRPLYIDLRADNKCNLACISCGPDYSSLWAKELNLSSVVKHNSINYESLHQYKKIYMAGGEPLIISDYIKVLNFIAENNLDTEVVINTNLTNLSKSVITAIKKIKKLSVTVSVDAYGKINEYHRYPLKWSKFLNNLETIYNCSIPIDFNTVVDAVSIFGIGGLNNISHIPNTWNLSIITRPNWLALKNIPEHLKPLAISNLEALKTNRFFNTDIEYKTKINQIEKDIMSKGDSQSLIDQIKLLDSRRKIYHADYMNFCFYSTQ